MTETAENRVERNYLNELLDSALPVGTILFPLEVVVPLSETNNVPELIHADTQPFECPECHKRFRRRDYLQKHSSIHTENRPYHCQICNKTYMRAFNLKQHLKIKHLGVRPYACEYCSCRFAYADQLKGHSFTHTGEEAFLCNLCGAKYIWRHQLKRHKCKMRSTHIPGPLPLPEQNEPLDLSVKTMNKPSMRTDSEQELSDDNSDDTSLIEY